MSLKKSHVKQGDNVKIIAGAYKGVEGAITSVNVRKGRVTVEGVAPLKKAIRPTQEKPQGGFKDLERPIHISNVALANGAKPEKKAESKKPAKKKVDKKK
jgi:large subunit ribosomal protein L24